MKLDRRAFVKFAVGAVLGIHASPLVFKLMDDVAIWTQNWSWVPVPEDGAVAWASTVNPSTGTVLKMRIINGRVKGERLVHADTDRAHPLMGGGVLPADASALQLLYNETIRYPAAVVRSRETGAERRVGWAEAVGRLAKALAEAKSKGAGERVVVIGRWADSIDGEIIRRFMAGYGAGQLAFMPDGRKALALAAKEVLGVEDVGFDLEGARFVISFGTPLLEGFGAPVAVRRAFQAWRKDKGRLVQVEPRASVTASQADTWIACNPGAHAAVALSMASVIVAEGLTAPGVGVSEDLKGWLKGFTPERARAITGADPAVVRKVAKAFAKAPRAVAVAGPGPDGSPGRVEDIAAVLLLNALAGKVGTKGGVVVREALPITPLGEALDEPSYDPHSLALKAKGAEVLIFAGWNPVFSGPQARVMEELARSAKFVVALTPYRDETAALADLVLPVGHFLESWGDCTTPYGSALASYSLHKPLISVHPQARAVGDVFLALAKALGGELTGLGRNKDTAAALKVRTKAMGKLSEGCWWVQKSVRTGGFGQLAPKPINWSLPAGAKAGLVMQPLASMRTSWAPEPITPYMLKLLPDTMLADFNRLVVEINPATARKLGLGEGDMVRIESGAGSIEAKVHLFAGAHPRAVFVPVGLGHSAFGMYLKGKGDNYNRAVEVRVDSALPTWDLTPVNIVKL